MNILLYDGSLCGLLTAVFEIYERRIGAYEIVRSDRHHADAFAETITIVSDDVKAKRVWAGLEKKLTTASLHNFYACYLSDVPSIEKSMLDFARYVFNCKTNIEKDFGHPSVLTVTQTARKVFREKHRMEAFVRFKRSADDIYYATIDPDHNVLPLIASHFKDRYADQHWIINDVRRKYGLYYDKLSGEVCEVAIDVNKNAGHDPALTDIFQNDEKLYQVLWKDYFRQLNIPNRKNLKLHLQHVPTRYWKFLTEKQTH